MEIVAVPVYSQRQLVEWMLRDERAEAEKKGAFESKLEMVRKLLKAGMSPAKALSYTDFSPRDRARAEKRLAGA